MHICTIDRIKLMKKSTWDDYKIAYQVAIDGSLSKAGQSLNINHATVLRHINQLEECLELKLFIRHQRGYKLTDAGCVLMDEVPELIARFSALEDQLQNVEKQITGELRITTISTYAPELSLILNTFLKEHPSIRINLLTTDDLIPLDSGVAHVSLRAGAKPDGVDLIVKRIKQMRISYYAHKDYVARKGLPKTVDEFNQHSWVLPTSDKYKIPAIGHIIDKIEKNNIILQCNSVNDASQAVIAGIGIGLISDNQAKQTPYLVPVELDLPKNEEIMWLVYHKDLKHSVKIQCFCDFILNNQANKKAP